jgi:hypothetical protein
MRLCYWRARKIARDPESHGKWIMIPVRLYRGGVITLVYERRGRQGQQAVLVGSR